MVTVHLMFILFERVCSNVYCQSLASGDKCILSDPTCICSNVYCQSLVSGDKCILSDPTCICSDSCLKKTLEGQNAAYTR